jgi:hypothetical protein
MLSLDIYAERHSDRTNLLVHLVAVPLFHGGLVAALFGHVVVGLAICGVSLAIQGRAHRREAMRPRFSGPFDFVSRILVEQLVTFPCFVLTGRFRAMLGGRWCSTRSSRS